MAEVVYTGITGGNGAQGTLFNGIKFWLSRKVPMRSWFTAQVLSNGGEVLSLEKEADMLIVDHARKEALPGTYSYQFIDKSIRNGRLEKLEDHAVGPAFGTIRAVGSSTRPAKTGRQKFTPEDDQILLKWVQSSLRSGAKTEGNEIYKQLEAKNPRHPWQSWRDRWVKYLRDTCPTFTSGEISPRSASGSLEENETPRKAHKLVKTKGKARMKFSEEDAKVLLANGEDIQKILPENTTDAWEAWAHEHDDGKRSAQAWQDFWEKTILPIYLKRTHGSREFFMDSRSDEPPSLQQHESKTSIPKSPVLGEIDAHSILSPSYQPESPEIPSAGESSFQDSRSRGMPIAINFEEPNSDPPGSQEIFYPAVEARTDNTISPKRKRAASEDEFPSSSPPHLEVTNKRQRRHEGSMPAEIAPTPEQSPIHSHEFSTVAVKSNNTPEFFASIDGSEGEDEIGHDDASENENENGQLSPNGNSSESDEYRSVQEDERILGRQPSPVLSEANHKPVETQTIFNGSTPYIDFEVAPPEDGWDESLPASSESLPSLTSLAHHQTPHPKPQIEDSPSVVESQTLLPDFSIPPPDGGWDAIDLPSDHPDSSPRPNSPTPSEIGALLDAWIDEHIASGFSSANVQSALECTSLDTDLAETVLRHMSRNQGPIPRDVAGVWTERDDEWLESSTDARRIAEVEAKHGKEYIRKRWAFLNACRS